MLPVFVSIALLAIFAVYLYKLISSYAEEESEVRENLAFTPELDTNLDWFYALYQTNCTCAISFRKNLP